MTQVSRDQVEAMLAKHKAPYMDKDLMASKAVKGIEISGGRVEVKIQLGFPVAGIAAELRSKLIPAIAQLDGVEEARIDIVSKIVAHQAQSNMKSIDGVKNIIAVASGKGGVGKSTTTVNLALALAAEGAKVGILDADIYGPSQGLLLGIPSGTLPQERDGKLVPIEAYNVQAMSMSFLVDETQPMVWRGPMVSQALQQLLNQTCWDNLDYLFVDMPPGTGDVQLTLSQKVPVTGAVIVTTPQDVALLDAKKGIEMFRKVAIPVVGVVENMSLHLCSQCGHAEPIFGSGGGARIAEQYETELLGALPLALNIREQSDSGTPVVVSDPGSEASAAYRDIALKVAASLATKTKNYANAFPEIVVQND